MKTDIKFEYISAPKSKFAILHTTGCGVAEDPKEVRGYICAGDNERELKLLCDKLHLCWNSEESIISSWVWHMFTVKSL